MEGIQFLAAAIVAGLAAIGAGLGFGMMGGRFLESVAPRGLRCWHEY